jgi:hypothetical protein
MGMQARIFLYVEREFSQPLHNEDLVGVLYEVKRLNALRAHHVITSSVRDLLSATK